MAAGAQGGDAYGGKGGGKHNANAMPLGAPNVMVGSGAGMPGAPQMGLGGQNQQPKKLGGIKMTISGGGGGGSSSSNAVHPKPTSAGLDHRRVMQQAGAGAMGSKTSVNSSGKGGMMGMGGGGKSGTQQQRFRQPSASTVV